jgi:transcriptional regulator with XRE-family HTH domain
MEEPLKILLLKYRRMKGYSQIKFAEMLGVKQAMISQYENGKRKPTRKRLRKIAELLEVDFVEFNEHECELISEVVENAEKMSDDELFELRQFSNFIIWKRDNQI